MSKPPPRSDESPLGQLSRAELEFLRKAIRRRQIPTPITELALQSVGRGKLYGRLGPLAGAHQEAALALIDMALQGGHVPGGPGGAGGGARAAARAAGARAATLVWTGPEVHRSPARPTTAMVLELLASARQRVIVVGYEFDHGAVIFEPLHRVMQDHGVTAAIYLDIRPAPGQRTRMDSYLAVQAHRFLAGNWPFGAPVPELYYFPAGVEHGSQRSLHGKCIVVDGRHVLVGSANFTRRGHGRNIEIGVRVDDAELAAALTGQLDGLVEQGALARLPVAALRAPLPEDGPEDDGPEKLADELAEKLAEDDGAEKLADELYVSAEARPLFIGLLGDALPAPRVGEDIEGEGGEVIASPELSWPAARVAVLLPEQEASRKKLEAAGWTCFSMVAGALGADELASLRELVGRAG